MSNSHSQPTDQGGYPWNLVSQKLEKKEQEKALANFYRDPCFRNAINALRSVVPPHLSLRDETVRKIFIKWARHTLSAWDLHRFPQDPTNNYKWLAWVWKNWNLDKEEVPACPSTIREPRLTGWTVHGLDHPLNFGIESVHRAHRYAWVTMTLRPGVSRAEAMKAFETAFYLINEPMAGKTIDKPGSGRPGMTIPEVKALHGVFEEVGLPEARPTKRQADKLRQVRAAIENSSDALVNSLRLLSDSAIKAHYGKWRSTKGAPPRRYYTEPASSHILLIK